MGVTGTMVGVLILSQDIPSLRQWNPLYVSFSMVVVLSEKARTAAVASLQWSVRQIVCGEALV